MFVPTKLVKDNSDPAYYQETANIRKLKRKVRKAYANRKKGLLYATLFKDLRNKLIQQNV